MLIGICLINSRNMHFKRACEKHVLTENQNLLKGTVHAKINIIHPQAIQDGDQFVSSSEQIWRNLALCHLLTNGSSAVNGCR